MKKELIKALADNFQDHSNTTENGIEFWFARDIQNLLGYTEWRNFFNVIVKAKTACETSGNLISDHFVDVNKTITMPKSATKERALADFLPTITIKAKDFATEITIFNAKDKVMKSEGEISAEHIRNNKGVRKLLLDRGIKPEELPVEEDIKKLERRVKSEDKKIGKKPEKLTE